MATAKKERPCPKGYVRCPKCVDGWAFHDDGDGPPGYDACYHCGNTGFISDEQAYMNRVRGVAGSLAHEAVMRLRESCNNDPSGEGWAFMAAENMLHEHEYTQGRVWEYEGRMEAILEELFKRDRLLLAVLIDRLDPEGKVKEPEPNHHRPDEPEVNPEPPPMPKTVYLDPPPPVEQTGRGEAYNDDDIPF